MVSIIDHSRLQYLTKKEGQKSSKDVARYSKQREVEAVRQAQENGYFLNVTKSFIEENFAPEYEVEDEADDRSSVIKFLQGKATYRDINKVNTINLSKSHIRSLGDIGQCQNLTICIVANNFITQFDALINCLCLTRLDLHGNQITNLPPPTFWSTMVFLQLLNLHDNPIGGITSVHNLSTCQNIFALTMYDTPVSLRRNYRHHAVNSVWSLKALDHHVISDEEIIEDANFQGPFSALSPAFYIDLCPPSTENTKLEEEMQNIHQLIRNIGSILAHNSPVIIIQRYFRGYRVRRKLGRPMKFRSLKRTQTIPLRHNTFADSEGSGPSPYFPAIGEPVMVPTKVTDSTEEYSARIDFESYYNSYITQKQTDHGVQKQDSSIIIGPHLQIDLNKLQNNLKQLDDQENVPQNTNFTENHKSTKKKQKRNHEKKLENKENKFTRIKDVKQFFGKVIKDVPQEDEINDALGEDEVHPVIKFRLQGLKVKAMYYDPTFDMIMARRVAGHEVRLAEADYHHYADLAPRPLIQRHKQLNNEQRFFTKTQGTMGLACLQAVQQAYRQRDVAEKKASKVNFVSDLRQRRDQGKSRLKVYQEERRNAILRDREQEQRRLADALEEREFNKVQAIDKLHDKRHKSLQYLRQRKGELSFTSDFNTQITSVSKALMKESTKKLKESELTNRNERLMSHKMTSQDSHDVVKKFLDHRQLMRQTESAMNRVALDTKVLQDTSERLLAAKSRVAAMRTRHDTLRELAFPAINYPSPPMGKHRNDTHFNALVM